jgi:sucrose-6F-phosphate phosphohydrolase
MMKSSQKLLVTDLDGTLIGDEAALTRFRAAWPTLSADYYLVYASGRPYRSIRQVMADQALPAPDAVISGVGSEIYDDTGFPWPGWARRHTAWSGDLVRATLAQFPRLRLQTDDSQTPLKVSYRVEDLTLKEEVEIRRALEAAGLEITFIYSHGSYLDILPSGAGKGLATRFLAEEWRLTDEEVLVFGDSGNDIELLAAGFRSTMVANGLPELRAVIGSEVYLSPESYADGILDGLRYWSQIR